MDTFTTHTGIGVPLRRSNVDTDQIIPAVYLKRVTRDGFEDGLFSAWRNDPSFVLNNPAYAGGSVLVAGPDFGTGSSREHAVWALQNYGFRPSSRRASPTSSAATPARPACSPPRSTRRSSSGSGTSSPTSPGAEITVDLESRTVRAGEGVDAIEDSFDIDDYTRWRLLEGLDDIGITLGPRRRHQRRTRRTRPAWKPATHLRLRARRPATGSSRPAGSTRFAGRRGRIALSVRRHS